MQPDLASAAPALRDAISRIRSGDRIFLGTGCAAPRTLLAAIEASPQLRDLEFVSFVTTNALPLNEDGVAFTRHRHRVFFVGSDVRGLGRQGRLEYVPISLEEVPSLLASGRLPIDVAIIQVSSADARGFHSLGISVDLAPAVMKVARHLIGEVNAQMPRTHGESFVHADRFDVLVEVTAGLSEYRHPDTGEVAARVARYISALVEDGSTLQIGLGRLPTEVLRHLTDRKALGIHSDVITDGIIDLVEQGVVTGRDKTIHVGRIVTSYAIGTRRLYDYVDDNPRFAFLPIDQVCDPFIVASNHKMVSITQAFAVDITGQICVDQLDDGFYGGVSTQAAFLRGAARSPGGKPIVCLASVAGDGSSQIKAALEPGQGVGIPRSDVHYVVTEYGIAYLFGRSIRERTVALIDIAHPSHRKELLEAAKRLLYIAPAQTIASEGEYPVQEERHVRLRNGEDLLIRPARVSDAPGMQSLFHRMSEADQYTRFFRRVRSLSFVELQTLCNVNHASDVAFLAVTGPRESETIVGSCCYFLNATTNLAEVAFMIDTSWQGRGLGSVLQTRLRDYAAARGILGFTMEILSTNTRMRKLARRSGDTVATSEDEGEIKVTALFDRA